MSKLVIIRGNSGSGKTTVAKALQHKLGHNIMVISQDVIRRDMLRVKDGVDTKALSLLSELLVYGNNNCKFLKEFYIHNGICHYLSWQNDYLKTTYGHIIMTLLLQKL